MSNTRYNFLTEHFIVSHIGTMLEKGTPTLAEIVSKLVADEPCLEGPKLSSFVQTLLDLLVQAGKIRVTDGKYQYVKGTND